MNNLIGKEAVAVTPSDTVYISDTLPIQVTEANIAITSVNLTTDLFTKVAHGLNTNDIILFTNLGTVTGISLTSNYYVIASSADTFQVSTSLNGSAIDLTGATTTAPTVNRIFKRSTIPVQGSLFVGVTGDVVVLPAQHPDTNTATPASRGAVLFKNVAGGTFLPIMVKKVFATATTATNMVCVYN